MLCYLLDPRKDRLVSNHGRLETPTTRWTFTKLQSGFERSRAGNILAMSVQQCLACNAVVSRACLENRFILFSMYNFSLTTDFKYMCFCLSVENCQLDGAFSTILLFAETYGHRIQFFIHFIWFYNKTTNWIHYTSTSFAASNKVVVCWQDIDSASETTGLTSTDSWILGNVIYAVFTDLTRRNFRS